MTLSERTRQFLDTAFELALTEEFMGGPTAEERQNIEAIRTEIDELQKRLAESWQTVDGDAFVTPDTEDSAIWVSGGNVLCICIDGVEACITLPTGLRLCQRTTAQEVEGNGD